MQIKIKFTIELGNDAMQTPRQIGEAIRKSISRLRQEAPITDIDKHGRIMDENGNSVGSWECFK